LTRNWYTNSVSVEHPVVGALKTFLVLPIPSSATSISNCLDGCLNALSTLKVVADIAAQASTGSVEGLTLIRDRHTNTIDVEDPVVGALQTFLILPVPCGTA
jgi:hypothetical protein